MISEDRTRTATTTLVSLDQRPEIGSTLALPHGENMIVRHVVPGYGDLTGVILVLTT